LLTQGLHTTGIGHIRGARVAKGVQLTQQQEASRISVVDVSDRSGHDVRPYTDAAEARSAIEHVQARAGRPEHAAQIRETLERLRATVEHLEHRMVLAERESALDPLTGLSNRRAWRDSLRAAEERCRRGAPPAVVAVVDLDDFKEINDTQGHAAGDMILTALARTLTAATRAGDTVARTGGDEFAVLAFGTDDADTLARRLEAAVAAAGLRASVGAADRPEVGGLDAAWDLADEAMYASKARRAVKPQGSRRRSL
jgi:diguanylate cyclase (GGDEF)-like protein